MQALGNKRGYMKEQLFERILTLLSLKNGKKYDILDFGCGSGQLLGSIHGIIGNDSKLIGIDSSEKNIEQAKSNYPYIDSRNEKFIDSFNLPDASFDIIISVDTLESIPNKTALLNEIHRTLKKDGLVLFAHWDWDTQVYNSENKKVIRNFVAEFADFQQGWMDACDGQMGRKLWGTFQGSGLFRGNIDTFTLIETAYEEGNYGYDRLQDLHSLVRRGILDKTEHNMILDEMKILQEKGEYFYTLNSYIYSGIKA